METKRYDLIVIGAGSGGISAANLGKNLGKKTAIVEKRKIGGDCTWFGCVPSKALIKSGSIAHGIRHMGDYGLEATSPIEIRTARVMEHVRAVRAGVYEEEKPEVFEKMGIDVYAGAPEFIDNHRIAVNGETLEAKSFIVATGSSPFVPRVEGLGDIPYLTNETLFDLDELPETMIVLGGGPIGTEMAAVLTRLGVEITILQRGPRILPRDDEELVDMLMERLREEGLDIKTNSEVIGFAMEGERIAATVRHKDSGETDVISAVRHKDSGETDVISADSVLVSVGRVPNVDGLALEKAGVEYSPKGIVADNTLRTTAKNIYVCGDVIGGYKFSHIAEYHSTIAVPNAVLPIPVKRRVDYRNIVWATFTDPELAHAGLTEAEAREKYGDSIHVYRYPYDRIDRAKTDLATFGLAKFICGRRGRILGIHILGERASDLLHEAQLAKTLGVPFHKIQSMIHIYPTLGDLVKRPSAAAYADKLRNNFFVKLAGKFTK